jgi:hypothetical protein
MATESEKVHYTLDKINTETLKSGRDMRAVSADLFASLLVIVELQQKQIDELRKQIQASENEKD